MAADVPIFFFGVPRPQIRLWLLMWTDLRNAPLFEMRRVPDF